VNTDSRKPSEVANARGKSGKTVVAGSSPASVTNKTIMAEKNIFESIETMRAYFANITEEERQEMIEFFNKPKASDDQPTVADYFSIVGLKAVGVSDPTASHTPDNKRRSSRACSLH
jgi:hypothetical protein